MKLCSTIIILALLLLQSGQLPGGVMEDARSAPIGEATIVQVNKKGVLERHFRLRSRLNTQLLYKK